MQYLKIKADIDLWELTKFGYRRVELLGDGNPDKYKKRIKNIMVAIDVIFRRIEIYDIMKYKDLSHKKKYIKDLIQAGLVEEEK